MVRVLKAGLLFVGQDWDRPEEKVNVVHSVNGFLRELNGESDRSRRERITGRTGG